MPPPNLTLQTPLMALSGIGTERAALLSKLGLHTVEELLLHRPRRYEDRRRLCPIARLRLGEAASAQGKIVALGLKYYQKRAKSVFEIILDDGAARLHCRWWNLPFMQSYFQQGDEVMVFGKLKSLKPRTIDHPETEVLEAGEDTSLHLKRIVPIYPLTEGLPQRWLRSLIWRALEKYEPAIVEPHPSLAVAATFRLRKLDDVRLNGNAQPEGCGYSNFPTRANAIHMLHFPEEQPDVEIARRRLAFDEFLELQIVIQTRRKNLLTHGRGLRCAGDNRWVKPFVAQLGFQLTPAQIRVLREIRHDLESGQPMRRLLQGDVGSGKTAVAAATALIVLESGHNAALMAPTEILAQQHFQSFRRWFEPLGLVVHLRTGSFKTDNSASQLLLPPHSGAGLQPSTLDPQPSLIIGTHALIESAFIPEDLGLVIIDEQHKFGVAQREQLVRKGHYPHLLVMTATPIPRTLALTLYGDLDVSVIDQMPPGRGQIKTFVRAPDKLPKVWEFVRQKIAEGRQAYVVYPRVEDTGPSELKSVLAEWEKLKQLFASYHVGLVHGRLKPEERDRVMAGFRAHEVHVLLATSVIEVGVDVPNATVMVIENAEQFGLAQLHQLRGRIGRGAHDSHCILVASKFTDQARQRLDVLAETTDGFRIAEEDMRLRGAGELLGQQQSGLPPFRFANFSEDLSLCERARQCAAELLKETFAKNRPA